MTDGWTFQTDMSAVEEIVTHTASVIALVLDSLPLVMVALAQVRKVVASVPRGPELDERQRTGDAALSVADLFVRAKWKSSV